MKLTEQDIHNSFCAVEREALPWTDITVRAQRGYNLVANELNKMLEQDTITITAIRCPNCTEMLESEHAEVHACWQKGEA